MTRNLKLKDLAPTHEVTFFDSMTMKNRTEKCRVVEIPSSRNAQGEFIITVEVDKPVQKRLQAPSRYVVSLSDREPVKCGVDRIAEGLVKLTEELQKRSDRIPF